MRKYEIMLILPAEADDAVVTSATDRIAQSLKDSGGQIRSVDRWGRRRLAYEIARQSEGYYIVVEFAADPEAIKELDRVLSLADEVIRFKIVVRQDEVTAAAEGQGAQAPSVEERPGTAEAASPSATEVEQEPESTPANTPA